LLEQLNKILVISNSVAGKKWRNQEAISEKKKAWGYKSGMIYHGETEFGCFDCKAKSKNTSKNA